MHVRKGAGEAKLVRCSYGAIFDVIVDLRPGPRPTATGRASSCGTTSRSRCTFRPLRAWLSGPYRSGRRVLPDRQAARPIGRRIDRFRRSGLAISWPLPSPPCPGVTAKRPLSPSRSSSWRKRADQWSVVISVARPSRWHRGLCRPTRPARGWSCRRPRRRRPTGRVPRQPEGEGRGRISTARNTAAGCHAVMISGASTRQQRVSHSHEGQADQHQRPERRNVRALAGLKAYVANLAGSPSAFMTEAG